MEVYSLKLKKDSSFSTLSVYLGTGLNEISKLNSVVSQLVHRWNTFTHEVIHLYEKLDVIDIDEVESKNTSRKEKA